MHVEWPAVRRFVDIVWIVILLLPESAVKVNAGRLPQNQPGLGPHGAGARAPGRQSTSDGRGGRDHGNRVGLCHRPFTTSGRAAHPPRAPFSLVVYGSYLKFDNRLFSQLFVGGFLLALTIFIVALATLHGQLV
jgi:hypothetical protein